jgi:hypothetical protein
MFPNINEKHNILKIKQNIYKKQISTKNVNLMIVGI